MILGIVLMGGTGFYIGYSLFSGELEASVAKRLDDNKMKPTGLILKLSRKAYRPLVMPYSSRLKMEDWKKKTRRLIIAAGLEDEIDSDELLAYKLFLGLVLPIGLYLYLLVQGNAPGLWIIGLFMIVGYAYPSIWLKSTKSRRHEEIKLQLPFVIDLLTLSTEAGLDFIGALQKVVDKSRPGPFISEIARMIQQIQLGTTRADALRDMAWRIDLSEISSLIAVLVTADQMGSPLGPVLRTQSDLIRTQRFTQAEKKGAAASQKLLFPLIFFIMPAVFIMIFGPVLLAFIGARK